MLPVRARSVSAWRRRSFNMLPPLAIFGWIGPVLGPALGGAIVSHLAWGFIFFVNIPIGLLGLNLILRHLPDYRQERKGSLDIVGWTLFGAGIALLSYVLEIFGEHFMSQGTVIALLAAALALITAYVFHSIRTPFPLLNTRLFRIRTFSAAVACGFLTRIGVGGVPFLLPRFYWLSL